MKSTINWDGILYNEKCFLYLLRLSSSFRLSSGTLKTSPREPFITLQDEMLLPINHHSISQIWWHWGFGNHPLCECGALPVLSQSHCSVVNPVEIYALDSRSLLKNKMITNFEFATRSCASIHLIGACYRKILKAFFVSIFGILYWHILPASKIPIFSLDLTNVKKYIFGATK